MGAAVQQVAEAEGFSVVRNSRPLLCVLIGYPVAYTLTTLPQRWVNVAMALAKELTQLSLPEIGSNFGGRDHTTVLHACRVIKELRTSQTRMNEDYQNLLRTLAG